MTFRLEDSLFLTSNHLAPQPFLGRLKVANLSSCSVQQTLPALLQVLLVSTSCVCGLLQEHMRVVHVLIMCVVCYRNT